MLLTAKCHRLAWKMNTGQHISVGEPLEATQLLVPVSWRRYCALRRQGLVKEEKQGPVTKVVDVPYSSEMGLLVDAVS